MTSRTRQPLAPRVVALAAGLLSFAPLVACGRSASPPVPPETRPQRVRVAVAERAATGRRIELAGTVAAETAAVVSSRVAAMVTAVHVSLGDQVHAGQRLISIDPTAAEGQAAQARGAERQAEAALALAQRNFERYRALAATQSASELELDLARNGLEQAKGALEQAKGAVAAAQSVARESVVVAPFAGRVAARWVDVGDLAAPGRPLVTVEAEHGRRLVVTVPETLARESGLSIGGAVAVSLDADRSGREIAGRIAEVSPGPDPGTHAYTVKIDLPLESVPVGAAGRAWLPGTLDADATTQIRVPRAALIESGGLTLVVVRDGEGRAQSRVVTVGDLGADGSAEILSGLAGGDTVVLGLTSAPANGAPLEVEP